MSIVPPPGTPTPPAAPPRLPRHALGLPAGSVRGFLAFGVLGLLWLLTLSPVLGHKPLAEAKLPTVFVYLQILMVLILASFFAAHGATIGPRVSEGSPLGLPRGTVRGLLLFGYLGLAAYLYHTGLKFEFGETSDFIRLLLLVLSCFLLAHVLTGVVRALSGGILPPWFQDIQAWVAILAMFALGILLLIQLFINPSLPEDKKLDLPLLDAILAALVAFYFGARA
jgi:hypothetical protein